LCAAMPALPDLIQLETRQRRRVGWLLFFLAVVGFAYFITNLSWNGTSRMALTLSMADHGELNIDRYHASRWLTTGDKSFFQGHYYSDKAIGLSLLSIVPHIATRALFALDPNEGRRLRLEGHWLAFVNVACPAALALMLLFHLAGRGGASATAALFPAIAIGFASPVWSLASAFFGHVAAGAWLFFSFHVLRGMRASPETISSRRLFLAGLFLGITLIIEYPVAPIVLFLAVYGGFVLHEHGRLGNWRLVVAAVAGAAIPLGILLCYNAACFGSPWRLSYQTLANAGFRAAHAQGIVGVGIPSWKALAYITVHPIRGLFAQSPVLLLGFPGLWRMWKHAHWRAEAILISASLLALLAINAGFPVWWGGWSSHARHLVPILFLLGVPLAFLNRPWRIASCVLLAVSVAQTLVVVLTGPLPPDTRLALFLQSSSGHGWLPLTGFSPIYDDAVARLLSGRFRQNVLSLAGVGALPSLVPWVLVEGTLLFLIFRNLGLRNLGQTGRQPRLP